MVLVCMSLCYFVCCFCEEIGVMLVYVIEWLCVEVVCVVLEGG